MSEKYICRRCNYSTDRGSDIKRHIFKKISCIKNINSMKMSDDQIIVLSILPYNKNNLIEEHEIEHLNNSDVIIKNKIEFFELINDIDKNRIKICKYCNLGYSNINDLKKHIILQCFYKDILKKKTDNDIINNSHNSINYSNITGNNNNNINNNTNNNTNITNYNIFLGGQSPIPPIPFDDKWDISKINDTFTASILNSKYMYSQLLREILENEINLNVIIDKDSNSGLVYKNDIDKYIRMKSSDIVNNTMDKLKDQLLEINKKDQTQYEEVIDFSRKMITKKHIDYNKDVMLNKNVNHLMSNIYNEKKDKATKIFTALLETDNEYERNILIKNNITSDETKKLKGF
jgi:hypothetical protein